MRFLKKGTINSMLLVGFFLMLSGIVFLLYPYIFSMLDINNLNNDSFLATGIINILFGMPILVVALMYKRLYNIAEKESQSFENNKLLDTLQMSEFDLNGKTLILGKTRSGKFNPYNPELIVEILNKKEVKTTILNFYRREYKYFVSVGVNELLLNESTAVEGYRFIMFQLQTELSYKREYGSPNKSEAILYLILSNDSSTQHKNMYSDHLVEKFKNVLKEVL